MDDLNQSRFASIVTLLVGIWVAISPVFISVTGGARTSLIITGIVIALAGLVQIFWANPLPSLVSGLASIWLFISAFAFANLSNAIVWSAVISAVVVFLLSIWDEVEISHVRSHMNELQHR